MNNCAFCGKEISNVKKYCDNKCQQNNQRKIFIEDWKSGKIDGGKGNWGKVSDYVRSYLMDKYNSKCSKCGWGELNIFTNSIPLEIEHIDGDAMNHTEENLTLLCPNCHSLTATYRGANKGNGRGITWKPSEKLKRL